MGKRLLFILMTLIHLGGIFLFCAGFFPIKSIPTLGNQLRNWASKSDQIVRSISEGETKHCIDSYTRIPGRKPVANISKFVVIIIDGLREDFILAPESQPNVPFISGLLKSGRAVGMKARTQAPTVTLPRVKAMIAGSVPAFIDAIMNLNSPTLDEDSLVKQLRLREKRIVFYGDEVWQKLFPNSFLRSEGTSAFFVSDYTEVDNNVTRHLDRELKETDWDVMILHYAGVDHIGHSFGPRSHLLPIKMKEMDGVVEKIYEGLSKQTMNFAISIMGDHGMSDVGSHGGATDMETSIPLFFGSPMIDSRKGRIIKGFEIQQIDFVPTFSALMGLPIPEQSLGIVVSQVLEAFSVNQVTVLSALAYNFLQIRGLYRQEVSSQGRSYEMVYRYFDHVKEECTTRRKANETVELIDETSRTLAELRNELIISFTNYSLPKMIFGAVLTSCVSLYMFRLIQMWGLDYLAIEGTLVLFVFFARRGKTLERNRLDLWNNFLVKLFLLCGSLLHALSLGSSSFVEEEHQTWYFLWTSLLLCLLYAALVLRSRKQQQTSGTVGQILSIFALLVLHRIGRSWNQTGVKFAHLSDLGDWLNEPAHSEVLSIIVLLTSGFLFGIDGKVCFAKIPLLVGIVLGLAHQFSMEISPITPEYLQAARENRILIARTATGLVLLLGFRNLIYAAICFGILNLKLVNIPLILLIVLSFRCMSNLILSPGNWCTRTIAAYWFSLTAYFYLGSSNSLGTVDISCGYFLVESHQAPIVAVPVTLAVYLGPILTWSLFSQTVPPLNRKESFEFGITILFLRSLPLAFYGFIVMLHRNHLFVWSVFAPKLLYEASHSVMYSVIICFIVFLRRSS